MKLQFKNSPTIVSEDMDGSKMGLAAGSGDMFTYFLRDKIYKDKILAPIRETICNGWDEHVKYNVDKPLDIKIENINGQYMWSCRDYAKGLSEHDVRNVFGTYGASKKRDNNDQIGGFGVGAASPLAYTDTYYVTSYFEGVKTQYVCTLGGGENGVEVGTIYKINEEPTSESGLEVSFDISKDYYVFNTKTQEFVKRFLPDANINYKDNRGDLTVPLTPTRTKIVNGYTIHQYEDWGGGYCENLAIRMGGVVYKNDDYRYKVSNTKDKIVVDVPIGKLSIPISREEIEETQSNKKVLDEIEKVIEQIRIEDRSIIKAPKFTDIFENGYNNQYEGEWFTYSYSEVFPDSWKLRRELNYLHTGWKHNVIGGNYTIYQIPDIKSYKSWIKRLDHFVGLTFPETQIIWMKKPSVDIVSTETLDVSNINFVDVKKLGLPKLKKDASEQSYLVYLDGYKKGTFTAEELDQYVTETYFNDEDIVDGWEKKIDSMSLLRKRVIGLTSDHGTSGNCFWVCNSKKLKEQLLELGWFELSSPEYKARYEELRNAEKLKENMQYAECRIKDAMFRIKPSDRLVKIVGKNPNKLDRLKKVRDILKSEDSVRGRILNSIESYSNKITRSDLRKILLLK